MKLVVKIGGSLSVDGNGPRYSYFSQVLPLLEKLDQNNELSLGVGGGGLVRKYGEAIENFDLRDEEREECFIQLIKANVKFLSLLLNKKSLFSLEDYHGEEVVVGAVKPGRSTDANAALVAEKMNADLFIILTDVDGIYDRDPEEHEDAKLIDEIHFKELDNLKGKTGPLHYGVIDPTALKVIQRDRIETRVVNGEDPKNLMKAADGEEIGTHISAEE